MVIKILAIILLLVILLCFIWIIQVWRHFRMIPLIPTFFLISIFVAIFNPILGKMIGYGFDVVLYVAIFCDYFKIEGSEPILDRMFGYRKTN